MNTNQYRKGTFCEIFSARIFSDFHIFRVMHLTSWMTTLPIMVIGMVSIVLVIGVIVLAVMFLNKLTSRK